MIFVFGSNLQGRHGKGAALYARHHHGAIYGQAEGHQGNSYGIPTKSTPWQSLPLWVIGDHIRRFCDYARANPGLTFQLTPIGCGLAGYKYEEIAPLFKDAPENVLKPKEFRL